MAKQSVSRFDILSFMSTKTRLVKEFNRMNDAVEVGLRISPLIHRAKMKPSKSLLAEKAFSISGGPFVERNNRARSRRVV